MRFPTRIYDVHDRKNCIGSLGIYDGNGQEEWSYPPESESKDALWNVSRHEIRQRIESNINIEEFPLSGYIIRRRKNYSAKLSCPQCGRIGAVSFQERENPVCRLPILTIVRNSLSTGFVSDNEPLNIEISCDRCGDVQDAF